MKRQLLVLTMLAASLLFPFLPDVHAACSPCSVETDTNVPASSAAVWVRMDAGTPFRFNHTFSVPWNTTHTFEVMNTTLYDSSTGARFLFKQWLLNGVQWGTATVISLPYITVDYTSSSVYGALEAQFVEQFQLSLTFADPSGQSVNPPSSVTLTGPYSVTLTYTNQSVNQYSNQWLQAGLWTVSDASWEGQSGTQLPGSTIDLTRQSTSATVRLAAYPATIKIVDNSNNPLPGAVVTVTLVNGTSRSYTTDKTGTIQLGRIPLGTYSAHVIYQSQDQSYTVDASLNPVNTIKLGVGGGSSAPLVSAAVLLTIFGLALFLIILAIRVRKPPPPPMIN